MKAARFSPAIVLAALAAVTVSALPAQERDDRPASRSAKAWTLDEALQQLAIYPRDSYLQYVALQLASREGRLDEVNMPILEKMVRQTVTKMKPPIKAHGPL